MDNKKNRITIIIAVLVLIFMVAIGTYAYFAPQTGGTTSKNATVTSNTTDLLTFSINRDINFTVTQNDFQVNGQNKSGDATATATLTPNNKTGAATMHYYLYLNILENDLVYTTEEPGYYVNTDLLVPFSDTTDPEYSQKYYFSNEYIIALSHNTGKIGVDEIAPLMRELFESLDAEVVGVGGVYNLINQDMIDYNYSDLPVEVLTDEETGDSRVVVGDFDEDVINYLISLGWFRKVGNPELVLQVYDNNNNLVEFDDIAIQITTKGVKGYDITTKKGLITLLDNHAISASNNTPTIENWRVVLTLINLDNNQNDNTGKTIEAELIIRQDEYIVGYTGLAYRNNANTLVNGESILPGYKWCDIEIASGAQFECYNDETTCNDFLTSNGYDTTDRCEYTPTGGIGDYENNINNIKNKGYTVYCPTNNEYPTCEPFLTYNTEAECINLNDTSIYTCTAHTLVKPYYLKHEINNNIVESTSVCMYYNNHEFCLDTDYWDTDDVTTKNKLQNELDTIFGTSFFECDTTYGFAFCNATFDTDDVHLKVFDDAVYFGFPDYDDYCFTDGQESMCQQEAPII